MTAAERERLTRALHAFVRVQRLQLDPKPEVVGTLVAVLVNDLANTGADLEDILAALEQHRLEVGYFPRIHELRARLGLAGTGARKRIDTWGRPMNSCPHEPGCRSMTACRDRILEDARAERAIAERAS